MNGKFAAALAFALAGCVSVPDADPGQVIAFNGNTVTIRGGIPAGFAATASPSSAMTATARGVCPSATYASAAPVSDPYSVQFDYLFLC
jgi:hypothetical protein